MSRKSKSAVPVLRYRYDGPQRNIGFTFSPLYLNEAKSGGKPEEMLFIYDEDFVYIRPAVSRAFPFRDPVTGEELDALDPCWENPIPKGRWGAVLAELDQLGGADSELRRFVQQFTDWARHQLEHADGIEITGNL
ncbi:hypothetical protein MHI24_27170 [Paenibacillus sp. FSL K6-1096]|uniref:hypothetical protein n=1 Tax=Paenibacillus sp. FSL K6-1096 TaxID=2921460 RepID=UPI0030EBD02F